MFLPFLYDYTPSPPLGLLWVFYKYLNLCAKHGWPMVANEEYFRNPSEYADMGMLAASDAGFAERLGYTLPSDEDLRRVRPYVMPGAALDRCAEQTGSYCDAAVYLSGHEYPPMVEEITRLLKRVQKESGEPIEAIFSWRNFPSLARAARKLKIPVIYNELGPLRRPTYAYTAYLDFQGNLGRAQSGARYRDFLRELRRDAVPVFDNRTLLSILLEPDSRGLLSHYEDVARYRLGIAAAPRGDYILAAYGYQSDDEMLLWGKKRFPAAEILYRVGRAGRASWHMTFRRMIPAARWSSSRSANRWPCSGQTLAMKRCCGVAVPSNSTCPRLTQDAPKRTARARRTGTAMRII